MTHMYIAINLSTFTSSLTQTKVSQFRKTRIFVFSWRNISLRAVILMHCNISILLLKVECFTVEFDHPPLCLVFNSPFSSGGLPVP